MDGIDIEKHNFNKLNFKFNKFLKLLNQQINVKTQSKSYKESNGKNL